MNLFFVKERCPTSLSLAGYLLNRGEKCVEVLDYSTWIIPSKDEVSLCFAATNVIDIIKNNEADRVFVQSGSKNIDAVILASLLSELKLYVIDYREDSINLPLSLLSGISKLYTSQETKLNFLQSGSATNVGEEVIGEDKIFLSPHYPPERNWFQSHNFFSIIPASLYSHNNYSLPNYIEEGTLVSAQQRAQALRVCQFFRNEACSSWKIFEEHIFATVDKNDKKISNIG